VSLGPKGRNEKGGVITRDPALATVRRTARVITVTQPKSPADWHRGGSRTRVEKRSHQSRSATGATTMLGQVILDKYRVLRQLDEGGMSKVYLARQMDVSRDVVVKVLKEHLRNQAKSVEHFRREIYITSRFHHPYSVACYDSAAKGPFGPVLVMELL